jgi:hypothetical protein
MGWETFEATIDRMCGAGLVFVEGAAGKLIVIPTDLGMQLIDALQEADRRP